jgi:hypothetical protein
MKNIIALLAICLAFVCNDVKAQSVIQYPNGPATITTVTLTTKVPAATLSVTNRCHIHNLTTHDTSLVITFSVARGIIKGSVVYVKIKNSATAATRTITGSTGCTMASYTMTSNKTHLLTFVYDGTNYLNTDVIKID